MISGWLEIEGSHAAYSDKLTAGEDLGVNAIFTAPYDCSGGAPPAPPPAAVVNADFDVAKLCADTETYKTINEAGLTFCSKYDAATGYEFLLLVKPDFAWGAVGFNTVYKMIGTEVMWLGVEDGAASLKYKQATAKQTPTDYADADDQPQGADVANTLAGIQARWTRPLSQGSLMTLTDDTSAVQIITAWKTGTPGTFGIHSSKAQVAAETNLAAAGSSSSATLGSATKGNLAHGALMILAWGCFSPIGTMFMKYGKHLPATIWFKTHKIIQPLAILVTILGFILILASGVALSDLPPKSKTHANMGLGVIALCIVQGLLGYFRSAISNHEESDKGTNFEHGKQRARFTALHRIIGWTLFGLSIATIYKGINVFADQITVENPKAWLQEPASNLFLAFALVSGVMILVLELLHVTKYEWGSGGPFSCSGNKEVYVQAAACRSPPRPPGCTGGVRWCVVCSVCSAFLEEQPCIIAWFNGC